jgi:hypothetical protein
MVGRLVIGDHEAAPKNGPVSPVARRAWRQSWCGIMREVQRHGLLGKSDACCGFESRSSLATAVEMLVGRADFAKTLGAMRE